MPELVPKGPNIPVDLLNQLGDERVVFFCGAGVSMGGNSNLPGFHRLLCHVYQSNHIEPDAVEAEALQESQYDKAFELLERSERLGSQLLYESVVARLSVSPAGSLKLHRDLLALSRVEGGYRLVTTNFDNRFGEALAELLGHAERLRTHDAPALPVPNRHRWPTLVHLHGRIQPEGDRSDLILTSADFGRAYLTERWAARFVTTLFREFTVVFVGYSLSDPVMKYLVDAVAAERAKGGNLGKAYAFVGCDPSKSAKVSADWTARNVEPILYDDKDDHTLLRDTFRKWVGVRSDPQARTRIALDGVGSLPERGDPEVARVTWALERSDVAQALAQAPPITGEQNFPKIERWLDVFAKAGLLSRAAVGPATTDGAVNLVDDGTRSQSPPQLGEVTYQLARWIARHVHVPQVLGWVVRQGGKVHPELRREILWSLAKPPKPIPPKLRLFWTVLLSEQAPDPWRLVFLEEQYEEADGAEKRSLEEVLLSRLVPRLTVLPGPSRLAIFRQRFDPDAVPMSQIEACGHLRVRVGHGGTDLDGMAMLSDAEFLCRYADRITTCLVDALVLLRHDDQVSTDSMTGVVVLHDPTWIAAGSDRLDPYDQWIRLIDLARDSYFALVKTDRARAAALLHRWSESEETTCKRLILHALAEDEASEANRADAVLLRERDPGIWHPELRNEMLRFLNKAGSRLRRGLVKRIVKAIQAGPDPAKSDRHGIDRESLDHAKIARLLELHLSGAKLDGEPRRQVAEAASDRSVGDFDEYHRVFSARKAEIVRGDDRHARDLLSGPLADLQEVLCGERDQLRWEDLDALVREDAGRVAEALRECAEGGEYPPEPWWRLMSHLASIRREGNAATEAEDDASQVLSNAPDDLFAKVTNAAEFVRAIAQAWDRGRESEFRVLWEKAWNSAAIDVGSDNNDPVSHAINHGVGKLAEAALFRLWKHEPPPQSGVPSSVRCYFDMIATSSDGHPGRVVLVSRLNFLFAIDPEWTEKQLIRRLDPSTSPSEALDLWAGFVWSPRLGPNLLQAIKGFYFAVLARDDPPSRTKRGLVDLLIAICLGIPEELTKEEVRAAVRGLSEQSLCVALRSLKHRLTGSSSERAQAWNDKIQPKLKDYWPREGSRNSAVTSEHMMRLVIGSGDGFPEAVSFCKRFLKPVESHHWGVVYLKEHIEKHPAAVLELLSRVVQEDLPQHFRPDLREVLEAIASVQPRLGEEPSFRRLHQIASGG